MLTTLRISGLAVVDAAEVRFGPGLNVLTGETGAGKSILVNALHLVLGGRMGADVLRDGADEAVVEALFELPPDHPVLARLAAAGIPAPEPAEGGGAELLVRRVASRGGRGRAFVNGALCTVGMLESALRGALDICGQHEHVALLRAESHTGLLDAFAGAQGALARYRERFDALAAAVREREALARGESERAARADYLAFQLREIDALAPEAGEDQRLEQERVVLAQAARLRDAAARAEACAYGEEGSAAERLGLALRALEPAAHVDPRLEPVVALLRSAAAEVDEAGRALARYGAALGGDPERLSELDERLGALRALARKHGGSLARALERAGEMRAELAAAAGGAGRLEELAAAEPALAARAAAGAAELTRARASAARAFCAEVQAELGALAMGRCRIEVAFRPPEGGVEVAGRRLAPGGAEEAELLIAPNPGEAPRPLARIASGGELSRVLLAVKRALSRTDPMRTYVFDEVDSGIGGAVAEAVGRRLLEVSRGRQVICVTHLPQVAAFADRHHRVEKRVSGGRTFTAVRLLEGDAARREEVARMLAGATLGPSALEHAAALLEAARAGAAEGAGGGAAAEPAPRQGRRAAPVRTAARVAAKKRSAGAGGSR
ncbi:DNA repair protein RecN [Anaeromyxobacter paludicola]|uniref:DNA repair protein RecN n=1 Tax=Anaeromyxobacter paludicola TaxID=2918171 RepID=A0ABN6N6X2_9BACT|nr:DNA repair protein RecN [Anaeromyxobacter paludicola]BDG08776.1 DNA repair protein RecN [Anaeromyxobacter paludicola]